jgi:transcriptional regulator with XRE-family HTH domain
MFGDMQGLGNRMRAARKAANLTQVELADRVGCRQQLISQIERGKVDYTTFYNEFAQVLGVDPAWLITGKGSSRPEKSSPSDEFSALADLLSGEQRQMLARWMKDLLSSSEPRK